MQSTLSEQIQAIMKARLLVIKEATSPNTSEDLRASLREISSHLNDAGSTIASLNLTKDINKSCEIRNGERSWEMTVDGREFNFVGSDFAEYLRDHFNSIGYNVQFIDQE